MYTSKTKTQKQKRRSLKIVSKNTHTLTRHRQFKFIPAIQLQGQWLQDAGFMEGGRVQVDVSHKCIIIKPEKKFNQYLLLKKRPA
jgi:hypothetical protein